MQGTVLCNVTVRTVNRDKRHFVVYITFTFFCIVLVAAAWVYVSQQLMTDVPKVVDVQCSSVFVWLLKNSSSLRCRTPPTYFYTALNLNSVWVGHSSFSFTLISFSCLLPCRSCAHNEFLYISICQGSSLCSLPALRREAFFCSLKPGTNTHHV
jgi:hypothetical protein